MRLPASVVAFEYPIFEICCHPAVDRALVRPVPLPAPPVWTPIAKSEALEQATHTTAAEPTDQSQDRRARDKPISNATSPERIELSSQRDRRVRLTVGASPKLLVNVLRAHACSRKQLSINAITTLWCDSRERERSKEISRSATQRTSGHAYCATPLTRRHTLPDGNGSRTLLPTR